jgi:hypothetical protein
MGNKKVVYKGGMGLSGWLTILFTALKLTGYINWSWWWVTSPIWIPLGIAISIFGGIFFIAGIISLIKEK